MSLKLIKDKGDARVDIIFVHGFKASEEEPVWTSSATSAFWPDKFLPGKVPEARIFSYEYECPLDKFWNIDDDMITVESNEMLEMVMDQRSEPDKQKRPVIFIAHCLGGLIVENALIQNANHDERKVLVSSVRGILLFGTPHYTEANLSEVAKYFHLAGQEVPEDLTAQSQWVKAIPTAFASFRSEAKDLDFQCFYEGTPIGMAGLSKPARVVESAVAKCPEGPTPERLAPDHHKMVQFEKEDDKDFGKVVRVLKRWVSKLPAGEEEGGARVNITSNASFERSSNWGYQLGQNTGAQTGFRFGG